MKDLPPAPPGNSGGAFFTPLRYPGGKGRLGPWLAKVLKHNSIANGWYVEPYAGGAGAGLYLLTQGHVDHIVINDADPVVHAFWRAATEQTDDLVKRVLQTPVTMDTWRRQKAILEMPEGHTILEIGFAAFFLNRTNRSGILSAGVIGGKAQAGTWKLDARYRTEDLVTRIRTIGSLAAHITVLGIDALDLLSDIGPGLPEKCLVYLDPPYFLKGSLLYRNHYQTGDHAAIARCVSQASYPVIVTYDECPEVRRLYGELDSTNFSLQYSTTHLGRPHTSEALFYRNLDLPSDPLLTRGFHLIQQVRTKSSTQFQKTLRT